MSHSPLQHWSSGVTALAASTTVKTLGIAPRVSGQPSTGVAFNQGSDLAINRTAAAAFSTTTLVDSVATPWTASAYVGHVVAIVAGTGLGNVRVITANTNQALTVDVPFSTTPDGTTRFTIYAPSTYVPVITDYDMSHTATASSLTWQSVGLQNGVLTTRDLVFYPSAATGTKFGTGACLVGIAGGDVRITPSAAAVGFHLTNGYWIGAAVDRIG